MTSQTFIKPLQIIKIDIIEPDEEARPLLNEKKPKKNIRSNSVDCKYKSSRRETPRKLFWSCLTLTSHYNNDENKLVLKSIVCKTSAYNMQRKNQLTLPNSHSKISLNCLNTPIGSIFDVSDTNSIVYKNEVDDIMQTDEQSQNLSEIKLDQLDEQLATDYKLKCKNWLQHLIESPI